MQTSQDSPRTSEFKDRSSVAILALAVISSALTGPGQTVGVSVFSQHLERGLNLDSLQVTSAYAIGTLASASLLPKVGRLIDRNGVRRSQVAIGVVFILALINMSQVQGWLWLIIGFFGIRLGGQGALSLVSMLTVQVRFIADRGKAVGIFSTAANAFMLTVPLGLAVIINQVGWRSAWLVAALIIGVTVIPIAVFGYRQMPKGSAYALSTDEVVGSDNDFTRAEAFRTRTFWIVTVVTSVSSMLGTGLNFHQIDLLGQAGLSETEAAAMFVPQIVGSSIAGLGFGYLADRYGTRLLPALGMALLVAAHWLATSLSSAAIIVIYAVSLGGMGSAVRTVAATMMPHYFGTRHLGSIQGAMTLLNVAGSAAGPIVLTVFEENLGGYRPAVMALSVIPILAIVFSLLRDTNIRSLDVAPAQMS